MQHPVVMPREPDWSEADGARGRRARAGPSEAEAQRWRRPATRAARRLDHRYGGIRQCAAVVVKRAAQPHGATAQRMTPLPNL